jgi:sulfur-carrier protein adenylyltransferase/sulfurtransferase
LRPRTAAELYPEICNPALDDDREPSCRAVEALERQSPFVNSTLAQHALALLVRLFRYSEISRHGGFINLATGASSVLRTDSKRWKRMRKASKRSSQLRQGWREGRLSTSQGHIYG